MIVRVAGTASRRLAAWLAEQGYVTKEGARDAAQIGREAARDLPAATDLAHPLYEFAQRNAPRAEEDEVERTRLARTTVDEPGACPAPSARRRSRQSQDDV